MQLTVLSLSPSLRVLPAAVTSLFLWLPPVLVTMLLGTRINTELSVNDASSCVTPNIRWTFSTLLCRLAMSQTHDVVIYNSGIILLV